MMRAVMLLPRHARIQPRALHTRVPRERRFAYGARVYEWEARGGCDVSACGTANALMKQP